MKHISDLLWCEIEKLIPQKETAVGRPEFDNKKHLRELYLYLKQEFNGNYYPKNMGVIQQSMANI